MGCLGKVLIPLKNCSGYHSHLVLTDERLTALENENDDSENVSLVSGTLPAEYTPSTLKHNIDGGTSFLGRLFGYKPSSSYEPIPDQE